jgi:ABC-2 type transport system ATP-binding protein
MPTPAAVSPVAHLESVICFESLTKDFGTATTPVRAVDHISFVVPRGSITALLGGNGAGKTTTIMMVLGLLLPTSGHARVLGYDMARDRHLALPRMNFSSPYVDLPGGLSVRENLTVYGRMYAIPSVAHRVSELADTLQFTDLLRRETGKLSAGQKTRVALAKALINEPDVLILDEPTASLDPDTGDWVRQALVDFARARKSTIFFASHNMTEVERMADTALVMKSGKIYDQGAPADLISRYGRTTLEDVFLDIARGRTRENGS